MTTQHRVWLVITTQREILTSRERARHRLSRSHQPSNSRRRPVRTMHHDMRTYLDRGGRARPLSLLPLADARDTRHFVQAGTALYSRGPSEIAFESSCSRRYSWPSVNSRRLRGQACTAAHTRWTRRSVSYRPTSAVHKSSQWKSPTGKLPFHVLRLLVLIRIRLPKTPFLARTWLFERLNHAIAK